jgi:hypothetical protein
MKPQRSGVEGLYPLTMGRRGEALEAEEMSLVICVRIRKGERRPDTICRKVFVPLCAHLPSFFSYAERLLFSMHVKEESRNSL